MLDFRGSQGVKGQKIAQNEKKKLLSLTRHIKNSTAYDHEFWYTF